MNLHIKGLSAYAKEIIQNTTQGCVHSVYRNTINIIVNDRLLAIQTANSPISPISLITAYDSETFADLTPQVGETISFDCSHAEIYELSAKGKIPHAVRHSLYRKFISTVLYSQAHGFNLIFQLSPKVDEDMILAAAENIIHDANSFYRKGKQLDAADKLCSLIGLGIGLTPSGDDFLCGILAGLHIQGIANDEFAVKLRENIFNNLSRTNEISQAFLQCALDGQFNLAVTELWNNPEKEQISEMFHSIGHSSGMDMLCGIYFLFFLME